MFTLTDTLRIKLECVSDPSKRLGKGYYPCTENIMHDLTFSDPLGINISSPPETLHVILLAHRTRLLSAFARVGNVKLKKTET